jgi:hypothetical protein
MSITNRPHYLVMRRSFPASVRVLNARSRQIRSMLKLLSLSAISVLLAVTGATALEGRFDRPKYKGGPARLDVCDHFAKACGQPAADDFCQMMGYARASKFETEHATPTRVMNFGQECQGAGCAAFKYIVCFTNAGQRGPVKDWPHTMD